MKNCIIVCFPKHRYLRHNREIVEYRNMSKVMQNIVLLMEPSDDASDVSSKAGNMYLNRFCIDEDAAFESMGVYYLKKLTIELFSETFYEDRTMERKAKEQRKYCLMD